MKRVLCVITSMASGGAERQMCGLAKMLKQEGYEVKVVWYAKGDFYKSFLIDNNIQFSELYATSNFQKIRNLAKEVKRYKPQTVISFLTGPNIFMPLLKMLGLKFRLIVSDRNTLQRINWKYKLCFELFRFADVIVPNSYSEGIFIEANFPCLAKKVRVITNFTDSVHFSPAQRKEDNVPPRMLVVARVIEQKNVARFLEAVKILKERGIKLKIDWYGDSFEQSYREARIADIEKLGISDYIKINPSTDAILQEYRNSDAFCLPSLYEGFPNVVCEAMSCGLPILCSDVCDNPYIVEDGVNGYLFDPESPESMANTIIRFVHKMYPNRERIALENRKKIQELCSEKAFINKYLKIIE